MLFGPALKPRALTVAWSQRRLNSGKPPAHPLWGCRSACAGSQAAIRSALGGSKRRESGLYAEKQWMCRAVPTVLAAPRILTRKSENFQRRPPAEDAKIACVGDDAEEGG